MLLLHYISEGNIVLLLHYTYLTDLVTSYFTDCFVHTKYMKKCKYIRNY